MEQVYVDGAYTVPCTPPAAFKPANNNKNQLKSRSLVAIIILLVICLVLSVAALALTLRLWNRSRIALEEQNFILNETQRVLQSLSDEVSAYHQVETALAFTLGLWNRSRVALQEQNFILNETQQVLQSLSDEVYAYHQVEADMSCPSNYIHNPYANSCLRLVNMARSWAAAKLDCQSGGEKLATFETLESQYWFFNLRKTRWKTYHVWVGGSWSSGGWTWEGETSKAATLIIWGTGEPNRNGDTPCIESSIGVDYKFNDHSCSISRFYVCERLT